ncbi:(Fe-S)-binding protein [Thermodesulfobacteriota bacterium]
MKRGKVGVKALDEYRWQIEMCTFCPKMCRFVCPVADAETRETVTPTTRQTFLNLLRTGHLTLDEELSGLFYECTNCLTCRTYCEHEIEVPISMNAARAIAVERDLIPNELRNFIETFREAGSPFGADLAGRLREVIPDRYIVEEAQVVYFAGCSTIEQHPKMIGDAFELFEKLGIDYISAYSGDAQCCGYPLLVLGDVEGYEKIRKGIAESLDRYRHVVCACPACAYMLKALYREAGLLETVKVEHISEFLAKRVEGTGSKGRIERLDSVFYHDPCYLGRYLGIYDAPRRLIHDVCGIDVSDFPRDRDRAGCCGGGGGLTVSNPDTALKIAERRMEALTESGGTVVTACPSCLRMFETARPDLEVLDLASFLNEALRPR